MIDIETLGNKVDAAILSIGACVFDIETGEIGETYYKRVGLKDVIETQTCKDGGRKIDHSTLKWWLDQDAGARAEAFDGEGYLYFALDDFENWFGDKEDYKVWGNGATFDISILEHAIEDNGGDIPWKFWNIRDVRTVVDLAHGKVERNDFKFEGVAHHALDDAKHQAKYVSAMWMALVK